MSSAERPVLLACASSDVPRIFPDDVLSICCVCGASIYHRPGALAELGPQARAACLPCAAHHEQQASRVPHADGGTPATAGITRDVLIEAARYLSEHTK